MKDNNEQKVFHSSISLNFDFLTQARELKQSEAFTQRADASNLLRQGSLPEMTIDFSDNDQKPGSQQRSYFANCNQQNDSPNPDSKGATGSEHGAEQYKSARAHHIETMISQGDETEQSRFVKSCRLSELQSLCNSYYIKKSKGQSTSNEASFNSLVEKEILARKGKIGIFSPDPSGD